MCASRLTEEQVAEFTEAFSLFDKDGDGAISTKETKGMFRALGMSPSERELEQVRLCILMCYTRVPGDHPSLCLSVSQVVTMADSSEANFELTDILNLASNQMKDTDEEEEIVEAFKVFDRDGSGLISSEDLCAIMTNLGEQISPEEIDQMKSEADMDSDGRFDYRAFAQSLTCTSTSADR